MYYDSHVHSLHSMDSTQPFPAICDQALELGLKGISITDHADVWFLDQLNTLETLSASIADAKEADARLHQRLRVFCGVELGEFQDDPRMGEKILHLTDYDVILSSVHAVHFEDWDFFYSAVNFGEAPEDKLQRFLEAYFQKLLRMAEQDDFDVLTHLTCPLRYINGKYHRGVDWKPFAGLIDQVLEALIRRGKSLEVNTSGINSFYGDYLPGREIIQRYHDLGGQRITLGSDAHTATRLSNAFDEASAMLQEIGFAGCCHYEQRKPCLVPWEKSVRL